MRGAPSLCLALALSSACGPGPLGAEEDSALTRVRNACERVCPKLACDGSTEFEPAEIESCVDNCSEEFVRAQERSQGCATAYENYLVCLDALSCEAYLNSEDNAACQHEADQLRLRCAD